MVNFTVELYVWIQDGGWGGSKFYLYLPRFDPSQPSQSSNWGGDLRETQVDVPLSFSQSRV